MAAAEVAAVWERLVYPSCIPQGSNLRVSESAVDHRFVSVASRLSAAAEVSAVAVACYSLGMPSFIRNILAHMKRRIISRRRRRRWWWRGRRRGLRIIGHVEAPSLFEYRAAVGLPLAAHHRVVGEAVEGAASAVDRSR